MAMTINKYGTHTIKDLIKILQHYAKKLGEDTYIYFSDFEFNNKQTQFEITQIDDEEELFFMYERHEESWD